MTAPQHYLPLLQTNRWFSQLPAALSQTLLSLATVRSLHHGEALFLRDGPACGLYALVAGAIQISGQRGPRNEAREALLVVLRPTQWFGEISLFDNATRTHHAHATEASTVLHIPHDTLLHWLDKHPEHWRSLAMLMAEKLRMAFISMEEQVLLPAPLRLIHRLLDMAEGYSQPTPAHGGTRRVLTITQDELARMVGVSRQTANQILNQLQTQRMVRIQRGGLEIVDLPALRAAGQ